MRLPDYPKLLRELRLLERVTHRGGKDSVDQPRNQSDDYANAACGVLQLVGKIAAHPEPKIVVPYIWSKTSGVISDPCPASRSTTAAFYAYGGSRDPFAREW